MNGARDELLARAALTEDAHRDVTAQHSLHLLRELAHLGALTHDRAEHAALTERAFQAPHVIEQLAPLPSSVHGQDQPIAIERLGHVVVRARAHRGDRGLDLELRGDDDDR